MWLEEGQGLDPDLHGEFAAEQSRKAGGPEVDSVPMAHALPFDVWESPAGPLRGHGTLTSFRYLYWAPQISCLASHLPRDLQRPPQWRGR